MSICTYASAGSLLSGGIGEGMPIYRFVTEVLECELRLYVLILKNITCVSYMSYLNFSKVADSPLGFFSCKKAHWWHYMFMKGIVHRE